STGRTSRSTPQRTLSRPHASRAPPWVSLGGTRETLPRGRSRQPYPSRLGLSIRPPPGTLAGRNGRDGGAGSVGRPVGVQVAPPARFGRPAPRRRGTEATG